MITKLLAVKDKIEKMLEIPIDNRNSLWHKGYMVLVEYERQLLMKDKK